MVCSLDKIWPMPHPPVSSEPRTVKDYLRRFFLEVLINAPRDASSLSDNNLITAVTSSDSSIASLFLLRSAYSGVSHSVSLRKQKRIS